MIRDGDKKSFRMARTEQGFAVGSNETDDKVEADHIEENSDVENQMAGVGHLLDIIPYNVRHNRLRNVLTYIWLVFIRQQLMSLWPHLELQLKNEESAMTEAATMSENEQKTLEANTEIDTNPIVVIGGNHRRQALMKLLEEKQQK